VHQPLQLQLVYQVVVEVQVVEVQVVEVQVVEVQVVEVQVVAVQVVAVQVVAQRHLKKVNKMTNQLLLGKAVQVVIQLLRLRKRVRT
jgi:hypothetical protein